jgi:hypothetical protein
MSRAALALCVLVALAGCGGGTTAAPATSTAGTTAPPSIETTEPVPATTTTAPPPAPTLTSLSDLATCNVLQRNIAYVSGVVSQSVDFITQSLHPKELAERTGIGRKNLLYAADLMQRTPAPKPLRRAKTQLVTGLRRFAGDFLRAQRSVAKNDLAKAAFELVDRPAVAKIAAGTKAVDRACGR